MKILSLKSRRLIQNLVLALAVTSLVGLIIEFLIRALIPQHVTAYHPRGLFEKDPVLKHRLRPGYQGTLYHAGEFKTSVNVNSVGLRGAEIQKKAPGMFRILALGDSFTFGWGVEEEEAFVNLLETHLKKTSSNLEALSGGVPGYGISDEAVWLKRYGIKLQPDLVLLCVFLGNDLFDATLRGSEATAADGVPEAGPMRGFRLALYRHSHFYRLFIRANLGSFLTLPEPWLHGFIRDMLSATGIENSALAEEGRDHSRKALTQMIELARVHDFRLAAVLLPARFQIDPEVAMRRLNFVGIDPDEFDLDAASRFFHQLLIETNNIPTLDLTTMFRERNESDKSVYFPQDAHWTPLGHQLAAATIGAFLVSEGLLDRESRDISEYSP